MSTISVIVPCYNEQETLPIFVPTLKEVAGQLSEAHGVSVEVVLVDDGSSDDTLAAIRSAKAQECPYFLVRWLSFSRNFGKEATMFAGLEHATGDYVAIMDADMQDPPSLLPQMYEMLTTEDIDCVATRRTTCEGESPHPFVLCAALLPADQQDLQRRHRGRRT